MNKAYSYVHFDDKTHSAITSTIYPNGKVVSFCIPRFQYERKTL